MSPEHEPPSVESLIREAWTILAEHRLTTSPTRVSKWARQYRHEAHVAGMDFRTWFLNVVHTPSGTYARGFTRRRGDLIQIGGGHG